MYTHEVGGKHKMYTQEVRGDKSRTLQKYKETQDVRPRIRGKHKPYAQGEGGVCKTYTQEVRRNTRRTLER